MYMYYYSKFSQQSYGIVIIILILQMRTWFQAGCMKVTQLVSGRASIQTHLCLTPKCGSQTTLLHGLDVSAFPSASSRAGKLSPAGQTWPFHCFRAARKLRNFSKEKDRRKIFQDS